MNKKMKYDVEADWLILKTCNFRCEYCFEFFKPGRAEPITKHAGPNTWAQAFDATGKTWLLYLTGGEPTLYPGFPELCEQLTQNHFISINSNLSGNCIEEFCRRVNPNRVHHINAALHWVERMKARSMDSFAAKVHMLKQSGFAVFVSVLMTPNILENYSAIAGRLKDLGLVGVPKVFRGEWEGKTYPEAYTADEKATFLSILWDAEPAYAKELDFIKEQDPEAIINLFNLDEKFLNGIPSYKGSTCGAGKTFVNIDPDGTVHDCDWNSDLGNILQKNVKLADHKCICQYENCPYYCERYSEGT